MRNREVDNYRIEKFLVVAGHGECRAVENDIDVYLQNDLFAHWNISVF